MTPGVFHLPIAIVIVHGKLCMLRVCKRLQIIFDFLWSLRSFLFLADRVFIPKLEEREMDHKSDRVQCAVEGLQVDQEDQESNIDCSQTLRLLHLDYEYSESRLALSWILDSIQWEQTCVIWILDSMRCRYLGNVDHYQYEVNLDVDHYQYEGQHILKLYIDTRWMVYISHYLYTRVRVPTWVHVRRSRFDRLY